MYQNNDSSLTYITLIVTFYHIKRDQPTKLNWSLTRIFWLSEGKLGLFTGSVKIYNCTIRLLILFVKPGKCSMHVSSLSRLTWNNIFYMISKLHWNFVFSYFIFYILYILYSLYYFLSRLNVAAANKYSFPATS